MRDPADDAGDVIGALADPLRRQTVSVLADRDPPVSLLELAAAVYRAESAGEAATDGGASPGDTPSDDGPAGDREQRVAAALYHVHLPKLDDAGVVSFDPESKEVSDWRSVELPDAI